MREVSSATSGRVFFIWVSELGAFVDHAVTDEEMAARCVESRGEYRALCGAVFLPASDDRPPGHACLACGQTLRARVPSRPHGASVRRGEQR